MKSRSIRNDAIENADAMCFIENIKNHNVEGDSDLLLSYLARRRMKKMLDVGFGTGILMSKVKESLDIDVFGVEKSQYLYEHTQRMRDKLGITAYCVDFLNWSSDEKFDAIIMSFYLHHVDVFQTHLKKALSMLNPNGSLLIMDRIALDENAIDEFDAFWREEYEDAHEWNEDKPNIFSRKQLICAAQANGYGMPLFHVMPTDTRKRTQRFPKTIAIVEKA